MTKLVTAALVTSVVCGCGASSSLPGTTRSGTDNSTSTAAGGTSTAGGSPLPGSNDPGALRCGDGIVTQPETCDDGNAVGGDGCSSTCQLEEGFQCGSPGQACVTTVCGDGKKEGTEQCDDGNVQPFDGCSPTCKLEPACPGGACASVCGDGILFPDEECDDGNNVSGDGCSADCKLEHLPGILCQNVTAAPPDFVDVDVVFRDFKGKGEPGGHPDFEAFSCTGVSPGLVRNTLENGKPVFLKGTTSVAGCSSTQITSAASFAQWYVNPAAPNMTFVDKVRLTRQPDSTYQFASGPGFFPLDGKGWGNTPGQTHNFHFTSELRYWFTYQGGEKLDFTGDDDVWVFINGALVVDLGGVHPARSASVTLDDTSAGGLTKGRVYELAFFHAERHTVQSNFTLTLGGFVKTQTRCASTCGDGIKTAFEECDDGNDVDGDGCSSTCTIDVRGAQ